MNLQAKRVTAAQLALEESGQTDFDEVEGWEAVGNLLRKQIRWFDENGRRHKGAFAVTFETNSDVIVDCRWE